MRRKLPLIGLVGMALLTAGCAVPVPKPKDINEERGLGPNNSVILGSASRSINTTEIDPRSDLGQVRPKRIVCAEPSPDAATTLAQSITAAVQAAGQQGQTQLAGAAAFGSSVTQGLIQMTERTHTIQLLRDSLYRACEAYANGALSDTSYALILSRYDETMVTMLSAELASGAFGRAPGALSGEAQHKLGQLANDLDQLVKGGTTPTGGPTLPGAAPATAAADEPISRSGRINQAVGELSGSAKVIATAGGGLSAQPSPQLADKLIQLHDRFTAGGGQQAMVVACLHALDRGRAAGHALLDLCREHLTAVTASVKTITDAKSAAEKDTAPAKARYDYQLKYAQIRAGVLADAMKYCTQNGRSSADADKCNALLSSVGDVFKDEFAAIDSRLSDTGAAAPAPQKSPVLAKPLR